METFDLFIALETKWDMLAGMAGIAFVGINWPAAEVEIRARRVPPKERRQVFADLSLMERAALPLLNRKRDG